MKVALVSTGLGRILRGFESFTESLFGSLQEKVPDLDVVLFQGGGMRGNRRVVVPNLHRYDVPARWFGPYTGNQIEKRSFALFLYPLLRRGAFDIVHYNELVMGSALFHLRRRLGGSYKLLYCDGGAVMPPHFLHRCDFAQVLTGPAMQQARQAGMPEDRLFLIPYGVDATAFTPETGKNRAETRRLLGIPERARLVLTVGALDPALKRIDHVIQELAKLDEPVWLLAAGQRMETTPMLEVLAERLLPGRWRFVSWRHEQLPLLYGAADVFVLASLAEAFGLVTVEAMLSGLPVIVHDAPVSRWLAGSGIIRCIDMTAPGVLAREVRTIPAGIQSGSARAEAMRRFDWESLIPRYLDMYRRVGGLEKHVAARNLYVSGDFHGC